MRLSYMEKGDHRKLALATAFLFLARVVVGSIFFGGGITKPPPNFNWFPGWVQKESEFAQIKPYKLFLDAVVIPHITFFGYLQFFTELIFGGLLLLGLFTRFSGFVLGIWAMNIALGSYPVPGEQITNLELFVLMPFLVGSLAGGRILGLDAWLRPKFLASEKRWVRFVGAWAM